LLAWTVADSLFTVIDNVLPVVRQRSAETIHLTPSVYPVLLILGRLCPSVAEGFNSSLRLEELVPFIIRLNYELVLYSQEELNNGVTCGC